MADKKTFRLFLDCSELPIWNFHRLGKNLDYRYLVKGIEDVDEVDNLPIDTPKIWKNIYNEYCDISNNPESQEHLQNVAELDELQKKYLFALTLLSEILTATDNEVLQSYYKELSAWGFAFDQSKFEKEIERFQCMAKVH